MRAELALKLDPLISLRAKERQRTRIPGGYRRSQLVANLPQAGKGKTRDELATIAGVAHGTIQKAKRICAKASKETKEKLRRGDVSIDAVFQQIRRQEKEEKREARREDNRAKVTQVDDPLASGAKYATILIDPPWDWGDEGDVDQMGRATIGGNCFN